MSTKLRPVIRRSCSEAFSNKYGVNWFQELKPYFTSWKSAYVIRDDIYTVRGTDCIITINPMDFEYWARKQSNAVLVSIDKYSISIIKEI